MLLPKRKVDLKLMRKRLLEYERSKDLPCYVDDFSKENKKAEVLSVIIGEDFCYTTSRT